MTATNHAITGALIGLVVGNPIIAIPVAFASHFILDAIPHFGDVEHNSEWVNSKAFKYMLLAEPVICFTIVLLLFIAHPAHWLTASFAAFFATSPDLFWIEGFIHAKRTGVWVWSKNPFLRFHDWIQWFQRPIGIVTEVAWLLGFGYLFFQYL